MIQRTRKGFTLIELLVVIAIIALLSTLAVVSLNNARQKSRDAARVAAMKQLQTGLELYFNDKQGYPIASAGTGIFLGTGASSPYTCLGSSGFGTSNATASCGATQYISQIPPNPTPNGGNYTYLSDASGSTYTASFTTEGSVGQLTAAGPNAGHTLTPAGMQ